MAALLQLLTECIFWSRHQKGINCCACIKSECRIDKNIVLCIITNLTSATDIIHICTLNFNISDSQAYKSCRLWTNIYFNIKFSAHFLTWWAVIYTVITHLLTKKRRKKRSEEVQKRLKLWDWRAVRRRRLVVAGRLFSLFLRAVWCFSDSQTFPALVTENNPQEKGWPAAHQRSVRILCHRPRGWC